MGLQLHLFGPPRLVRDGVAIALNHRKAWALLAYLAITARSHSRDSLATLLWPDYGQAPARGHLRRELARLRESVLHAVPLVQHRRIEGQLPSAPRTSYVQSKMLTYPLKGRSSSSSYSQ